ncbi:hypothetical protein H8S37_12745 [Mediterraneibacter sp. NSJ-55]|uniref:Uncharacterized protein n=1 Tax=Mediterraneibacter hominis TaxID=2763054 RepID=A0A923LJC6_9FIRM|nr:hypothetical protein [Mediterraneibacter hominis]MBC5689786.1 hypothetical protein [Mediterraneibacter hominis]
MKKILSVVIVAILCCGVIVGCGNKDYKEMEKKLEDAEELKAENTKEIIELQQEISENKKKEVFPSIIAETLSKDTGYQVGYGIVDGQGYQYVLQVSTDVNEEKFVAIFDQLITEGALVKMLMEDETSGAEQGYYNSFKVVDMDGHELFETVVLSNGEADISVGSQYFGMSTLLLE